MKKRVLRIHRPVPRITLSVMERTSYFVYNIRGQDSWFGYEWCRVPGSTGIPGYYVTENYSGNAVTSPSYLHRFNKNDFYHECFYGDVYLRGQAETQSLQVGDDLQAARNIYGFGGLRIFYPRVASTGQAFELFLGSPGVGVPSVWKHPHMSLYVSMVVHPLDDGVVKQYISSTKKESTARSAYRKMLSGYAPSIFQSKRIYDETIVTSNIQSFEQPTLYGREFFESYSRVGLNGALSDAANHADGFHFSRLAGEIAMDGLVINTISSLSERAIKSLKKAGPLKGKLATCFKLLPSVYLGYQYGISAPLREYATLPGAIQNQFTDLGPLVGQHTATFRNFSVSSRVSLNMGSPSSSRQAANLAYLTRGGMSLDDLWELVPLSFVVDWFLNISKFLESGRSSQIYSELPVKSATFSTSFERDVPLPDGVDGSIHHRCYIRKYLQGSSLPDNVFSFQIEDIMGTLSLRNVDEGLALFLSYLV